MVAGSLTEAPAAVFQSPAVMVMESEGGSVGWMVCACEGRINDKVTGIRMPAKRRAGDFMDGGLFGEKSNDEV